MKTNWFTVYPIKEEVYHIVGQDHTAMYLVEGSNQAILIDTGFGIGDLLAEVKKMTTKPVSVINTHGHMDHVLSNWQFPKAYLHQADLPLYEGAYDERERAQLLKEEDPFVKALIQSMDENEQEAFIKMKSCPLEFIKGGERIDLGTKQLEVFELPGHTAGSIVLIDRKDGILFSGDAIIKRCWKHLEESLPLEVYLEHMKALVSKLEGIQLICHGHAFSKEDYFKADIVEEMVKNMEQIKTKQVSGTSSVDESGPYVAYDFDKWCLWCKEGE